MSDRCYCVFEGGGAKGIAHVGALSALEESDLELCGFAGTSAGAVIAALAAVGYRSQDILTRYGSILDLVDLDRSNIWSGEPFRPARSPHKLFGPFGWIGIVAARNFVAWPVMLGLLVVFFAPVGLLVCGWMTPAWVVASQALLLVLLVLAVAHAAAGLASLDTFERSLNQLIRLRLSHSICPDRPHHGRDETPVTFADLARAGCPPLRVVASDITTKQLKLFSLSTTPDVGVSAAVAASVCLPVIFRPRRIADRLHLDGGLVSNLPAWVFDAERALDRDAWTAVIQVGDAVQQEVVKGIGILRSAIVTGIFGSGLLNVRNVDRLMAVRLKVRLKLLQFDPGLPTACEIAEEAKLRCNESLIYRLKDVPALMTEVCERMRLRSARIINRALEAASLPYFNGRIRASCFMRPRDDATSLLAEFQAGFADCGDERIRLPIDGSIVGQALRHGAILYLEQRDPSWKSYLARPADRWPNKLVWPNLKWVLCIPYVHPESGIEMVAAIDCDTYLALPVEQLDEILLSISEEIGLLLSETIPKEAFNDGGA